ncbi:uncharacterized protein LAESUDRAFT_736743 [Laetiporus sulphureus 93-53]|uniref:ER membrane protein complex subunit 7 beta-sandwich domain-containing protein n=1 Tax=Laetiporus sulphureus 93-53 TaxID=1314785 RepID=A0A165EEP1_9APHY|nr:uncharacterized protein LAESUDRAFT_736743 [Laetiporus sulphureus 93-53]KZT06892.1 hypothetical protein LAESUDRAFT_736743 [Laetiporus sulphureus 93-53]
MRVPLFLLALASLFHTALAVDLRGRISWNELCPNVGFLGHAKVVLDDDKLRGGITEDGGFVIPDVPAGTYILSVVAHDHTFDKLRVDVFETDSLPEVRPYIPGTPLSPPSAIALPYPIVLTARKKNDYFAPPQSFNLLGTLQSPMMLMMLSMGAMMLAMPYLMKNMDPEVLQDFNKRQSRIGSLQSSLQSGDISGGLSALLHAGEEEKPSTPSPSKTATSSSMKHRSGKHKKR